jgi:hypothetical protein
MPGVAGVQSIAWLASGSLHLDPTIAAGLDYWELDPAWDESVFRSVAQAVRPLRKGKLAESLAFPSPHQPANICLRGVSVNGDILIAKIR